MAKIRYIKEYDIVNGFWGTATSVWFQGCPHKCYKCFNPETWNENDTNIINKKNIDIAKEIIEKLDKYFTKTLSILGGEPLAHYNINDLLEILTYIKLHKNDLKIALWTGFEWEEIKDSPIVNFLDVVVTGKYIDALKCDYKITKNPLDKKRGSSNQQIIDVNKTISKGDIVLYRVEQ